MANPIYRADVTANLTPASADPTTMARQMSAADQVIAQSGASLFSTYTKLAEAGVKEYVKSDIADIQMSAQKLQQDFLTSNMEAKESGGLAAQKASEKTIFDKLSRGPQTPEGEEQRAGIVNNFNSEINRLKKASEGGMSNTEYVNRVHALTRNAIAKYPGLASELRDVIGKATGLEGADTWAAQQYAKERFAKSTKTGSTEADFVKADIGRIGALGIAGTEQELWSLYQTDKAAYQDRIRKGNQFLASKTQTESLKTHVEGLQGQSDLDADQTRASTMAVFQGSLGTNVLSSLNKDMESRYSKVLDLMKQGNTLNGNPEAFKTLIAAHSSQMLTYIDNAKREAYSVVDKYLANNPNVSKTKRDELYGDINRQVELMSKQYADDKGTGMLSMATIFSNYRDKTLKEQKDLFDLAIKQQGAMSNSPLVMKYWEGGASREQLKKTQPAFYAFMEGQEKILTGSFASLSGSLAQAGDLAHINRTLQQAQETPAPVAKDKNVSPEVHKATHEVVYANAKETLKAKIGTGLEPQDVNLIASAFATNTQLGANSLLVAKDAKIIGEQIKKLPEDAQGVIKDAVSRSSKEAMVSLQSLKDGIEAKYGVTLQFGVNDAGMLGLVRPPASPTNRPLMGGQAYNVDAEREFMKKALPIMSNLVHGRSMVTQEALGVISKEYATTLNGGQPPKDFFSLNAKPVEAPAQNTPAEAPNQAATPTSTVYQGMGAGMANNEGIEIPKKFTDMFNNLFSATPKAQQTKAPEVKLFTERPTPEAFAKMRYNGPDDNPLNLGGLQKAIWDYIMDLTQSTPGNDRDAVYVYRAYINGDPAKQKLVETKIQAMIDKEKKK